MNLALSAFAVGLSGFIALSYEILWYRALTIASGGRAAGFGLLLAFYLGGLALGARYSGAWCARYGSLLDEGGPAGSRQFMPLIFGFFLFANLSAALVLPSFAWTAALGVWSAVLLTIAIAAGLLGSVLPFASHFAVPADARSGKGLSWLYAANIMGSVAGSFLTGFVLLDLLSTKTMAIVLLAFGCGAATIFLALSRAPLRTFTLGLASALTLVLAGVAGLQVGFHRFYERLLFGPAAATLPALAQVVENRSGVIMVTEDGTVYGSGAYDGRVSTDLLIDHNMITRAYAVAGLHPGPRRVLVIGLGGGAWAQVVVHHPSVQRMTIVEINPGYRQVIARSPAVASLLSNPKVDFVIDDGRRWLSRHPDARFDLILANTTQHWRPHATNLLSQEYLRLIRGHLLPGGVYYFNTTYSPAAIRTAMGEYPYGVRVMNFVAVSDSPMPFDRRRFREVLAEYAIDGRPVLDVGTPEGRLRFEQVVDSTDIEDRQGVMARFGDAPIVTDDNMYPEWHPSPQFWTSVSRH